jgi:hypothetical protein
MTFVIGHLPRDGECMSCHLQHDPDGQLPFEPCPDQNRARELCEQGFASLPSSFEQFKTLVDMCRQP